MLWKCLEYLKIDWGKRKMCVQSIESMSQYRDYWYVDNVIARHDFWKCIHYFFRKFDYFVTKRKSLTTLEIILFRYW